MKYGYMIIKELRLIVLFKDILTIFSVKKSIFLLN
jgi:hypothetical protein